MVEFLPTGRKSRENFVDNIPCLGASLRGRRGGRVERPEPHGEVWKMPPYPEKLNIIRLLAMLSDALSKKLCRGLENASVSGKVEHNKGG